jgi:hydrogenase small subunit
MATPSPNATPTTQEDDNPIHILWINCGLSCDGESVSLTAATQPSIEEIALRALPGLPKIALHWPLIDFECGPEQGADNFIEWFHKADRGELDPFVLVIEGSIPNEAINGDGYFTGFGRHPGTHQPITVNEWLDKLAPKATIVLAVGTCATYGGIHAMAGNPTGAMGVPDYLGWDWKSKASLPIVCVPGCPAHPDNISETILYLLYQVAGQAPMIPLDERLRPKWLFGITVHEGCDRAGYYEQGEFAKTYDSAKCLVKLGCRGQVVKCNVPKRGWINGVGGCPNVGGICIGCTMPGFPNKFMPFMDSMPITGRTDSAMAVTDSETYGSLIRSLREFALKHFDTNPTWRKKGPGLVTGYIPDWDDNPAQPIDAQLRRGIGHQHHTGAQASTARKPVATGTRALVAVWCCSVGATWTLELHELNSGTTLGPLVDWISSGVPTSQPQPDEPLAHKLLADYGLHLYPDSAAGPCTHSRSSIGYVSGDP